MKRIGTKITDKPDKNGKQGNGGMHSTRAWKNIKAMIEGNEYIAARLYHIVLTPFLDNKPDLAGYQSAWKAVCLKLSRAGIDHQWRGCLELDELHEENSKGLHCHFFLMLEGYSEQSRPDELINKRKDGWLRQTLNDRGIQYTIAEPKDKIHWRPPALFADRDAPLYAALPKTNSDKIASCIEWISYLVKSRSKSDTHKTTYFSSRDKKAITT